MRRIQVLPNLITLANAFVGLLALAKAIDALALSAVDPGLFYRKMEAACFLVFLGMVFDSLDGLVARLTRAHSDFGAQLDSFSDALTFGVVPAMLAKVLIEHEGSGTSPRLHFLASASFALMAILRLVRFNLETESDGKVKEGERRFAGLPSPAAAGSVAATIWLYLILRRPELERDEGVPTPMHRLLGWMKDVDWRPLLDWVPTVLVALLPILGLLMVSRVRYVHVVAEVLSGRAPFFTLVGIVFAGFLFYLAPVPLLFLTFNGFALSGVLGAGLARTRAFAREKSA